MFKALAEAATAGIQVANLEKGLMAASGEHSLKAWSKDVSISDSTSLGFGFKFEFDAVIEYAFPIEYDSDAEEFAFIQEVNFYLAGDQEINFTTDFFDLSITIWTAPLFVRLVQNTIYLEHNDWDHCYHMN